MKIKLMFCLIILISSLNGSNISEEKPIVTNNERGFAYFEKNGKEVNKIKEGINEKDSITKLLKKILKVNTEIRDILKAEYNPEPQIIINSEGNECVANSSADCFVMPITNEAKKTPVYKNWLEKGDLESSLKKKQWEAKYFEEISKRAYMDMAAMMQFGKEAYPVNYNSFNYNNTTGYGTTTLRKKIEKSVLEKNLDKVNFLYFIGEDEDMDLYAMDNIVKFLRQYGNKIKLQFIFKNEKLMKAYKTAQNYNSEFVILNNFKMSVIPEEFENFNIYTTPSLVAINKKERTGQTVLTGRVSDTQANRMILMYMKSQNMIKDVDLNVDSGWKENSDFGKKHIQDYLGKDFLKNLEKGGM